MIQYNDELHRYEKDGVAYRNVTGIVKKYTPPFAADKIAPMVAQKEDMEVDDVLEMWEMSGKLAINLGEAVHGAIEYRIKYGKEPKNQFFKDVIKQYEEHDNFDFTIAEKIVADDELKIAGRLDIIKKVGDHRVVIRDIKTNHDLNKSYGYMLEPFQNLKDSNLNKYTLQLNIYRHLLERKNLAVDGMELWHWNDNAFKVIQIETINVEKVL